MKEKICNSRLIHWASHLKLVQHLLKYPFFQKLLTYEVISYLVCGGLTTVISYGGFFLFASGFHCSTAAATTLSFIFAMLFAFFANKIFVFLSPDWSFRSLRREFVPFVTCRLLSYGFDLLFSIVTIDLLHWNAPIAKILSNIFVLIANYFASKFLVFKKPEEK